MFRATTIQKIFSYLLPVKIWEGSSAHNPVLELFLHRGEWQLTTDDAVYSDGSHYRPLALAFKNLQQKISSGTSILVLGAGLGSAISILDRMKKAPEITLVDIDDQIIRYNKEWLFGGRENLQFVCGDAADYVDNIHTPFDMIVVDIFKGRTVPAFVTDPEYLEKCKSKLSPDGSLVINYIINDKKEWEIFFGDMQKIFPTVKTLDLGVNRVLIATV